jgi:hypothetical protein
MIAVAGISNRGLLRLPLHRVGPAALPVAGARNATLIALTYAWGASVLAAVYTLTGLVWQHGLQYAAGMALIACAVAAYAVLVLREGSAFRRPLAQLMMLRLTIVHAAAAACGLGFLLLSGKLASLRGDWAANIVFLVGGLAVCALSGMAALTQWRLSRPLRGS